MRLPTVVPILWALLASGCAAILPAHPNSEKVEGEKVELSMLTLTNIGDYKAAYHGAFGRDPADDEITLEQKASVESLASGIVPILGSIVADFLEQEASKYEQEYTAETTVHDFWEVTETAPDGKTITKIKPHFLGFKITRTIGDSPEEDAATQVYGFAYDTKGNWQIAPLSFQVKLAKAKVLALGNVLTFIPSWLWKLVTDYGYGKHVEVTTQLGLSVSVGPKDKGTLDIDKVSFTFPHYNLSTQDVWSNGDKPQKLHGLVSKSLLPVPWVRSDTASKDDKRAGSLTLTVLVKERDPLNAQKLLRNLAEKVRKEAK